MHTSLCAHSPCGIATEELTAWRSGVRWARARGQRCSELDVLDLKISITSVQPSTQRARALLQRLLAQVKPFDSPSYLLSARRATCGRSAGDQAMLSQQHSQLAWLRDEPAPTGRVTSAMPSLIDEYDCIGVRLRPCARRAPMPDRLHLAGWQLGWPRGHGVNWSPSPLGRCTAEPPPKGWSAL